MQAGKRQWREILVPVTAFVLLLPLLVGLALWQYERGLEKQQRWDDFERPEEAMEITGNPDTLQQLAGLPRYARIAIDGRYQPDRQVLLDNRPEAGRPGWHVLTPFEVEGADLVLLVDRGWLPQQAASHLGEKPAIDVGDELRRIEGRLADLPQPGLELDADEPVTGWPKPMQFPEIPDVALALAKAGNPLPVAGRILWLSPDAEDGYARNWKPAGLPPERHFAYAFQWAALAVTLTLIFVLLGWRWWRRPRQAND